MVDNSMDANSDDEMLKIIHPSIHPSIHASTRGREIRMDACMDERSKESIDERKEEEDKGKGTKARA